jgi:small subunit ribosomal protein S12
MKKYKGIKHILKNNPQRKGIITELLILNPKKPNSANRKISKLKIYNYLNNKSNIYRAYIPGIGHDLKIYNQVLIQGHKIQDLPGINFSIIRGTLNASSVNRLTKRSKYGAKKSNKKI